MSNQITVEALRVSNRVSLEVFGRLGFLTKQEAESLANELNIAAFKLRDTDPDETPATFGDNQPLTANPQDDE